MGSCMSRVEEGSAEKCINLMLLGAPAVGKSTIFKQLTMLYVKGFDDNFRGHCRRLVIVTTLLTFNVVLEVCTRCDKDLSDASEAIEYVAKHVEAYNNDVLEDIEHLPLCLLDLYQHVEFQEIVKRLEVGTDDVVRHIETPESGLYFLSRLPDTTKPDYLPSDADILRLRRETTKTEPLEFVVPMEWPPNSREMRDINVRCKDVGGQKYHEYDWVVHGKDCDAILFVCALAQFHETNENGGNALLEQLSMLRRVVEADAFQNKQLVLLINKSDLLEKALAKYRFADYIPDYTGPNTEKDVYNYFRTTCVGIARNSNRDTNIVRSCALDTSLMQNVLTKVLWSLFRAILKDTWSA